MKWAPNPYVLAERLSGKLLAAEEAARAEIVDAFLREALLSKGKKKTVTEAFAVFQQIAELFERPVSFGQALATARPIYQAAGYTTEQVIPALLDLLPIVGGPSADDSFADAGQLMMQTADSAKGNVSGPGTGSDRGLLLDLGHDRVGLGGSAAVNGAANGSWIRSAGRPIVPMAVSRSPRGPAPSRG